MQRFAPDLKQLITPSTINAHTVSRSFSAWVSDSEFQIGYRITRWLLLCATLAAILPWLHPLAGWLMHSHGQGLDSTLGMAWLVAAFVIAGAVSLFVPPLMLLRIWGMSREPPLVSLTPHGDVVTRHASFPMAQVGSVVHLSGSTRDRGAQQVSHRIQVVACRLLATGEMERQGKAATTGGLTPLFVVIDAPLPLDATVKKLAEAIGCPIERHEVPRSLMPWSKEIDPVKGY